MKSDFIYTQKQNKLFVAGLEDSSGTLRGKLPKHFQLAPGAEGEGRLGGALAHSGCTGRHTAAVSLRENTPG